VTLDLPTVLERIARHARELLDASDCAVFLPDLEGERMKALVALGTFASLVKATDVQYGQGILGHVWREGKAELINDAGSDPRGIRIEGTDEQPDEKLMVTPLLSGQEVIGLMAIWRVGGRPFVKANLDFLTGLARQATIAIENARLFAEAEAARAAAEEANRSKSAFLANVSHELRTPLTSILGFAHVVQNRLNGRVYPEVSEENQLAQRATAQIDESLAIILSEGERLTALINNVLDLEKIEAGKMEWHMEPLQMEVVMKQAIDVSISLAEQKGLQMIQMFPDSLPPVIGDRDKLVQVIINLISNAIKFTEAGEIRCAIEVDGQQLRVSVADSGIGIAPEDIDGVFAKFSQVGDTLTEKPRGTGLGLSIAREIIEHHGGRIWADSVAGQGSRFSFTLPIAAQSQGSTAKRLPA
jgi:signal transduction histidine kinase